MNQRLRQTREYTRQVVDSMANGLLSIDNQGKVLSYINLAIEFLGIDESEIDQINLNQV
jgi:PAS domain-containing protein